MKVVLFCGGQGMRLREYSERIPKPMVPIGYRPILWHVMKYYAAWGHKDFVLCLGHGADVIKDYFLNYNECLTNDFVLSEGGRNVELLARDIDDWRITFVDTGLHANIGERLWAVREHVRGEEMFLANYADGLTDCPLPEMTEAFDRSERLATFLCVRPNQTFHVVQLQDKDLVTSIEDIRAADVRINGGYFVLRPEIFEYMRPGEELVLEPFQRLIREQRLGAHVYDGFWASMDTFKDKQYLDDIHRRGESPWEVWRGASAKRQS